MGVGEKEVDGIPGEKERKRTLFLVYDAVFRNELLSVPAFHPNFRLLPLLESY